VGDEVLDVLATIPVFGHEPGDATVQANTNWGLSNASGPAPRRLEQGEGTGSETVPEQERHARIHRMLLDPTLCPAAFEHASSLTGLTSPLAGDA
jgi:hypothetical protein